MVVIYSDLIILQQLHKIGSLCLHVPSALVFYLLLLFFQTFFQLYFYNNKVSCYLSPLREGGLLQNRLPNRPIIKGGGGGGVNRLMRP